MIIKKRRVDGVVQRYHTRPKKRLSKKITINLRMRQIDLLNYGRMDEIKKELDISRVSFLIDKYPLLTEFEYILDILADKYFNCAKFINEKRLYPTKEHPDVVYYPHTKKDNVKVVMPRYLWNVLQEEKLFYFRNGRMVDNTGMISYVNELKATAKIENVRKKNGLSEEEFWESPRSKEVWDAPKKSPYTIQWYVPKELDLEYGSFSSNKWRDVHIIKGIEKSYKPSFGVAK